MEKSEIAVQLFFWMAIVSVIVLGAFWSVELAFRVMMLVA